MSHALGNNEVKIWDGVWAGSNLSSRKGSQFQAKIQVKVANFITWHRRGSEALDLEP